jgi:IS30 family transposase
MKLTDKDRREIKELHAAGNSKKAISEALGFSVTTVYMVVTGREWSDYYDRARNTKYVKAYRERKRMKGKAA